MVAASGSYTNAVLQSGEWLGYTIECLQEGYHSVVLKTEGPPVYFTPAEDGWSDWCKIHEASAFLHVELDGERFSTPTPVARNMVLPRIWLTKGIHRLQLVADEISDTTNQPRCNQDPPYMGMWEFFCVSVDWMEVFPSPMPLHPKVVAGSDLGFRDGSGPEAQLAGYVSLLGERASGDVLFFDGSVPALRAFSRGGEVRTLAGFPGNPVQDGHGAQAGFGRIIDAVFTPDERVIVLEDAGDNAARIRTVSPEGDVATVFSGRAVVSLADIRDGVEPSGQMTNRVAPLSRIVILPSGEIRAVSSLADYQFTIGPGPWQFPLWKPYTRHVWFRIADGNAEALRINGELEFQMGGSGPAPPPVRNPDLGGGVRYDGQYFGRLLTENPPSFVHELLPGTLVFTALRSREGALYAAIERGFIHRLDPDESLVRLKISIEGPGQVLGAPDGYVSADREITLTATPTGLFSVFEGWSDGSTALSRTIRLERDLWLNARFVVRPPHPPGIIPGTVRLSGNRGMQFAVAGIPLSHFYRLEQSDDLRDWRPVGGTVRVDNYVHPAGPFSVNSPQATVVVIVPDITRWYRVTQVAW